MDRRTFVRFGFSVITGSSAVPFLAWDHDGNKHDKKHNRGEDDRGEGEHEHGKGHRHSYFQTGDALYLHEYYAGPVDLPPGVRKKYYRTGKLPPGWEKRFRPFPSAVIERLPPTPLYCDRGYLDGYAVVYDRRTRVIVDLVDLLNVATGR